MLATRTAPTTSSRRVLTPTTRVAGRRVALVRYQGDKIEAAKRDAAQATDKAKDAIKPGSSAYDNDPQGVNKPKVDATDVGIAETSFRVQGGDETAYKAPYGILAPAFTRRREVIVGRLAIVGFAAAAFTEIYANGHPGPLAQVVNYTGLSFQAVSLGVLGFVIHGLAGVLSPSTNSRENKQDVNKRPTGVADGVNPVKDLGGAIGTSETIGFTKKNELFNGRMAMLGFLFAIMGELRGGGGAIAQIAQWLGNEPTEQWFSNAGRVLVFWSLFTLVASWVNNNMGELEGDESVY